MSSRAVFTDESLARIAQAVQPEVGKDLYKEIMKFRNDMSTAGLYYAGSVVDSQLRGTDLDPSEYDQYVMLEGLDKQYADYMSQSNMKAVLSQLQGAGIDLVRADGGEYAVRVLEPDGSLTEGGQILQDIMGALSDYPVLDDEDLSSQEYEATLENIESAGGGGYAKEIFSWLWDNKQNAFGEHDNETGGQWVDEKAIAEARKALGVDDEDDDFDEDDEDYEEPDPLAEDFATGPVPADPRQTSFPFKGGKRMAQMSLEDDAVMRMVTEEDAQLVAYRGGFALRPLDGRLYPIDEDQAALALSYGAEDRTQPKQKSVAASKEDE